MTDREQNRARMPLLTAAIDKFRKTFGPGVRVLYANENGHELGDKSYFGPASGGIETLAVVPDAPPPRAIAEPSQAKRPSGARHAPSPQEGLLDDH